MGEIAINPTHNVHQKYRQMNLVNPYIFSVPVVAPNLYIGGVASTINTPELLAAKFQNYPSGTSFSALNIQNFAIVGSDIKCTVIADYSIRDSAFSNNSLITYYIDNLRCKEIKSAAFFSSLSNSGGIYMNIYKVHFENVIVIGSNAFNSDFGTYGLKIAEFPNATTASGVRTFVGNNKLESIYIPKITTLGDTVVNNEFFLGVKNTKIFANPVLQTSNSGGVEGDLSYANSQGNTIRYVTNYTTPNSITNLSVGTIYNSAIQLNFTPPSSTNAIEYYECYANGIYKNNITSSGQYIIGLNQSVNYNITVIAVDVFCNKSTASNILNVSTNIVVSKPNVIPNLISYYKLDEIIAGLAIDSFGTSNLTNTGITINQSGKIDKSYLSTAGNQSLSATGVTSITGTFSLNVWCYRTANPTSGNNVILEQGDYGGGFGIWVNASNQVGWFVNTNYFNYSSLVVLPLNTWSMITLTYNLTQMKIYQDGVLKVTMANTTNPTSATTRRMFNRTSNSEAYIGRLDEVAIYSIPINQMQIDILYNSGNGTTL